MKLVKNQLFAFIILLASVSLAIFITVNVSIVLYMMGISYFHLSYVSNLSSTSLMKCYFFIIRYLEIPWDGHLHLMYFRASLKGLHHFRDVRHLILINNFWMIFSNCLSIRFLKELKLNYEVWEIINPLKIVFTSILVFLALAFVDFQQFFINFHRFMFRNQDWVFNAKIDPVIKVLPMPFFGWCFLLFTLILLLIWILIIVYVSKSVKKK